MEIDPVRIDDKDGSKEEHEEGGRSVDKSNCFSCLQFRLLNVTKGMMTF